eukprot:6211809-Pleurochrysis_carterae.AAC.4
MKGRRNSRGKWGRKRARRWVGVEGWKDGRGLEVATSGDRAGTFGPTVDISLGMGWHTLCTWESGEQRLHRRAGGV